MVFTATERMIAWRYIRSRSTDGFISLTSWLAVIGMVMGVATLILVTSLMNGIQHEMRAQLLGIGGHISITPLARGLSNYAPLSEQLSTLNGVTHVYPKIEGQVMASANGIARGAQVMAFRDDDITRHPLIAERMVDGTIQNMLESDGVLIGQGIADAMGLGIGSRLQLISPQGHSTIAGMVPRMRSVVVAGIFKLGMHAYDSSLMIMPFSSAQNFFLLSANDAVSGLDIMLSDSDQSADAARSMLSLLPPSTRIADWQQTNQGVFAALTIQRNVMVIILTLIILVAAFTIVACLVMLVKEKRSDIAILRTLGATRTSILRIFMLAGITLGAAGSLVGVGLGMVMARYLETIRVALEAITGQSLLPENIYFLSTLPTKTDPSQVVLVLICALMLSLLATLYPALKAARMHPVEALKHD